jgi:hypothetical protein
MLLSAIAIPYPLHFAQSIGTRRGSQPLGKALTETGRRTLIIPETNRAEEITPERASPAMESGRGRTRPSTRLLDFRLEALRVPGISCP